MKLRFEKSLSWMKMFAYFDNNVHLWYFSLWLDSRNLDSNSNQKINNLFSGFNSISISIAIERNYP